MAIAKTASRNVAFKVAKMRDSIMEDQDEHLIYMLECICFNQLVNKLEYMSSVKNKASMKLAKLEVVSLKLFLSVNLNNFLTCN